MSTEYRTHCLEMFLQEETIVVHLLCHSLWCEDQSIQENNNITQQTAVSYYSWPKTYVAIHILRFIVRLKTCNKSHYLGTGSFLHWPFSVFSVCLLIVLLSYSVFVGSAWYIFLQFFWTLQQMEFGKIKQCFVSGSLVKHLHLLENPVSRGNKLWIAYNILHSHLFFDFFLFS